MPGLFDPIGPDLVESFYRQDPRAAFFNYLGAGGRNLLGTGLPSSFAQGQYNLSQGQYLSQIGQNPEEAFFDYLARVQPDFRAQYQAQPAALRGDTSGRRLTPPVRYISGF